MDRILIDTAGFVLQPLASPEETIAPNALLNSAILCTMFGILPLVDLKKDKHDQPFQQTQLPFHQCPTQLEMDLGLSLARNQKAISQSIAILS